MLKSGRLLKLGKQASGLMAGTRWLTGRSEGRLFCRVSTMMRWGRRVFREADVKDRMYSSHIVINIRAQLFLINSNIREKR